MFDLKNAFCGESQSAFFKIDWRRELGFCDVLHGTLLSMPQCVLFERSQKEIPKNSSLFTPSYSMMLVKLKCIQFLKNFYIPSCLFTIFQNRIDFWIEARF